MVEIEVDKYYSNRGYYPYMTAQVFDALEAASFRGLLLRLCRKRTTMLWYLI